MSQAQGSSSARGVKSRRMLWFGLGLFILVICVVCIALYWNISNKRTAYEEETRKNQTMQLSAEAKGISYWITESLLPPAKRIVEADIVRVFASAASEQPDSAAGAPSGDAVNVADFAQHLQYIESHLRDAAAYAEYASGRIVSTQLASYAATETIPEPLTERQKENARKALQLTEPFISEAYLKSGGLMIDVMLPIFPPRFESPAPVGKPIALLILSKNIAGKVNEFITAGNTKRDAGNSMHLIQRGARGLEEITSGGSLRVLSGLDLAGSDDLPFAQRIALAGNQEVFSSGAKIPQLDWWAVEEMDANQMRANLSSSESTMLALVGMSVVVLLLLLAALWRWVVSREQRDHAEELQALTSVISSQNQLLYSINSALTDPISLTEGEKGVHHYVNRAFSQAVGRSSEEILGRDLEEVFGGGEQSRRLRGLYQQVSIGAEPLTVTEVIFLRGKRHYYHIVMAPMFKADENDPTRLSVVGVVSSFRDITAQVEIQERSQRVVQQTIDALVRAIEQTDPYLAGHSRMMSQCAMLLAREMLLPEADVSTIAAASSLSQIGKMFIPQEILTKPGALTAEEKREMERHVEYAHNLLENIEFELPVLETIEQMNEHMDGSGYPNGLKGNQIKTPARVLAVANAFCAMMRPRSYRPALPLDKALTLLANQTNQFDPEVVEKLRLLLTTRGGEQLIQQITASGPL